MYDQSFGKKALAGVLQKKDFRGIKTPHDQEIFRENLLNEAVVSANTCFNKPANPLISFPLKGRTVFMFSKLADELVARKLSDNIKRSHKISLSGRSQIVSNLQLLLEEGIPFRVYRLDIKSFYESFQSAAITAAINGIHRLSPQSRTLMHHLLTCHTQIGGTGLPRGLSLSATLSDLLMQSFDGEIQAHDEVFFYSRYVDDIMIITSSREESSKFIRSVEKALPRGLTLSPAKRQVVSASEKVAPTNPGAPVPSLFKFDYLGYAFHVREPVRQDKKKKPVDYHRSVTVDIAARKIMRFKMRISRAFLDFSKTGDWPLLKDRIKFLTKNFSVYNAKAGGKKIAGIYHSYPLVTNDADGLNNLDHFLRNATLSKSGRISSLSSTKLTASQKREILSHSFARGHADRTFVHFSGERLKQIQEIWKN